jgi:hypothetical protein
MHKDSWEMVLIRGNLEMSGRHADESAVLPPQGQHVQSACPQGDAFRPGYARREQEIPGKSTEPCEKKGGTLPKRQAECPGPEGSNNSRRSPHRFPQHPWETEARPVGTTHATSSMPRQRRVRRFSPADGTSPFLLPEKGCPQFGSPQARMVMRRRLRREIPVALPESEMPGGAGPTHDLPARTVTGPTGARGAGSAGSSSLSSTPWRSAIRGQPGPVPRWDTGRGHGTVRMDLRAELRLGEGRGVPLVAYEATAVEPVACVIGIACAALALLLESAGPQQGEAWAGLGLMGGSGSTNRSLYPPLSRVNTGRAR